MTIEKQPQKDEVGKTKNKAIARYTSHVIRAIPTLLMLMWSREWWSGHLVGAVQVDEPQLIVREELFEGISVKDAQEMESVWRNAIESSHNIDSLYKALSGNVPYEPGIELPEIFLKDIYARQMNAKKAGHEASGVLEVSSDSPSELLESRGFFRENVLKSDHFGKNSDAIVSEKRQGAALP